MIKIEEYKKKMQEQIEDGDREEAHFQADTLLCELLVELGHKEIVDLYKKVGKWYA